MPVEDKSGYRTSLTKLGVNRLKSKHSPPKGRSGNWATSTRPVSAFVPTLAIGSKVFSLLASGILLTNSFETSSLQIPRLSNSPVAIVKTALGAARWG